MRLLVFSDIHGQETVMRSILLREMAHRPDYVLFLGDGLRDFDSLCYYGELASLPTLAVKGNCDLFGASDAPELRELVLADRRVMMMHGHRFEVKAGPDRAAAFAASKGQELLLFGHTHVRQEKRYSAGECVGGTVLERPLVLFNPGSVMSGCYGIVTLSKEKIVCEGKSI